MGAPNEVTAADADVERATLAVAREKAAQDAAQVVCADRVVDVAGTTFRVRLELPNPGGQLPPGLR